MIGMEEPLIREFLLFVRAFGSGCFLLGIYDLLRIFRMVFRHPGILISVEDVCYWLFHALYLFVVMYRQNSGAVRGYFIAGVVLGMALYNQTVSPLFVKLFSGIFLHIRKICEKVKNRLKKNLKHITITMCSYFEEKAGKNYGEESSEKTQ